MECPVPVTQEDLNNYPELTHIGLVVEIARQYWAAFRKRLPGGLDIMDLINSGYLALREAMKYHPVNSEAYRPYAARIIRQTMTEMITMGRFPVSFRHNTCYTLVQVARGEETYSKQATERAKRLSVALTASLSEIGEQSEPPDERWIDLEALRHGLERVGTERHRDVLRMRFGLDGSEPKNLRQIGEIFGITRERVRQLEAEALDMVRPSLGLAPVMPI